LVAQVNQHAMWAVMDFAMRHKGHFNEQDRPSDPGGSGHSPQTG
jgi:hypothetical protein